MGEFETPTAVVFVPSNFAIADDWRPNGNIVAVVTALRSVALTLDVLWSKTLVAALSAASSANSVSSVAFHADLAVKHAGFSFRESCHGLATNFLYLIATTRFETYPCHGSNT